MGRVHEEIEASTQLEPARFGLALILIVASIFGFAFSDEHGWIKVLSLLAEGAALLFILRMSEHGLVLRIARIAVVLAVGAAVAAIWLGNEHVPNLATATVGALMAIAAPIAVVRRLSREEVVDLQVLAGALCLYLLIGMFFTFVYKAISEAAPGRPLFVQTSTASSTDITYFSFVTLTTVGYGDFTAAQNGVKLLAVTEALFGQLYLVSAVALVISQFGRDRPAPWRGRRGRRGRKADTADTDPTPATPAPDPDAPADP